MTEPHNGTEYAENFIERVCKMGSILRIKNENGEWVEIPAIVGPQGKTGESGVHFGANAPTDNNVRIWVDPTITSTDYKSLEEVMNILGILDKTDNGIKVDLSSYLKEGEAADKLGLTYVPVETRYTEDGHRDPYFYLSAPHIDEVKIGTTVHAIFAGAGPNEGLSVNGSALAQIKRYSSDSPAEKHPVAELGGFLELVYDGEDWICTNLVKPLPSDIDGFIQMRADIDYLADYLGVELT